MTNRKLDAQRTALFGPPEEVKLKLLRAPLGSLLAKLIAAPRSDGEHVQLQRLAHANVALHELALVPFMRLVAAWGEAGLLGKVESFDKFYDVAEDGKRWGAHAWGNAFDVNSEWNELRTFGARRGEDGSTHELEEVARPLGWVCGRQFVMGRAPRHFELLTLPAPAPLDSFVVEDVRIGGES